MSAYIVTLELTGTAGPVPPGNQGPAPAPAMGDAGLSVSDCFVLTD